MAHPRDPLVQRQVSAMGGPPGLTSAPARRLTDLERPDDGPGKHNARSSADALTGTQALGRLITRAALIPRGPKAMSQLPEW